MDISIGKLVHYKLTAEDVQTIQTMRSVMQDTFDLPATMQGEDVREGETFPAVVVKTQGSWKASLQVALPGMPGAIYLQSRSQGTGEGEWLYPELSEAGPFRDVLQHSMPQGERAKQTA